MVARFFRRKKHDRDAATSLTELESNAPALYDPRLAAFEDVTPDALPGVPDLYAVIGVDPRASDDAIRYAYRSRASRLMDARWRPTRAARRLSELNAAYEILGKPDRRADYDRQRMRQAAYERAELQASGFRDDPYEGTAQYGPRSAPPGQTHLHATTFDEGERAESFESAAPFHEDLTIVGINGSLTAPHPIQSTPPPRRRGLPPGLLARVRTIVIVVLLATVLALGIVALLTSMTGAVNPASLLTLGAARAGATPTAAPVGPPPTARPVFVQQPTPPTATPVAPTATVPAKPTAAPKPTSSPAATGAVGTQVRLTDQNPPLRSDVRVMVRVTRDGRALPDVPVWIVVYYSTVEERWPQDNGTVATTQAGEATVVFNIGDATRGTQTEVVAFAQVGPGEPTQIQTSFVPR